MSFALFLALAPLAAHAFNASHLFPVPFKAGSAYTTLPRARAPRGVRAIPLDDESLGVIKISKNLTHDVVDAPGCAPPGTQAWEAIYPEGSYNPSAPDVPRGGIGLYYPGPTGAALNWSDPSATQILYSYAVYFPADFEFVYVLVQLLLILSS